MKPLGRKYYKNKTCGKHHIRVNGKFMCWWQDVFCGVCKKTEVGENHLGKLLMKIREEIK